MASRIAVISDIHGNFPALEAVAADLQLRQVELVVNLGDHLSGPLWPAETAQYLMKQDWLHLQGNHDRQLVEQNPQEHNLSDRYAFQFLGESELAWLHGMPAILQVHPEMVACHGAPGNDQCYLLERIANGLTHLASAEEIQYRVGNLRSGVLLCGHSHLPRVVQCSKELLIVNPGSVGLQAYEDDTLEKHVSENGSPHARYAILDLQNGEWKVDQIAVNYDHHSAAKQASRNNRPDWAIALETGYARI
jgi:putative phosphoesterase